MINTTEFYNNYHGHATEHLSTLYKGLKEQDKDKPFIYLAGDSSLDNKYWIRFDEGNKYMPNNGYEKILNPPYARPDISYHMNNLYKDYYTINCAMEESSIGNRNGGLFEPDIFIKNHITENDILVVSIGGNDVALSPSYSTMWNMALLMYMNSLETLTDNPTNAWGFSYFIDLFKNKVKKYILKLIGDKIPKRIIVCMIYYPDEEMTGSWADTTLGYLGYNENPIKLQKAIEQMFYHATCKIKIKETTVVPMPLFHYLNGKDSADYVSRVEPSNIGGEKMAKAIIGACLYP